MIYGTPKFSSSVYVVKSSNLGLGQELLIFSIPSRTSNSLWFRSYQELVEHSQEIHETNFVNERTGKPHCPLPLCSSTFSQRKGMLYSLHNAALLGYFQSMYLPIYIRTVSYLRFLSPLHNQFKLNHGPLGQSNMHSTVLIPIYTTYRYLANSLLLSILTQYNPGQTKILFCKNFNFRFVCASPGNPCRPSW